MDSFQFCCLDNATEKFFAHISLERVPEMNLLVKAKETFFLTFLLQERAHKTHTHSLLNNYKVNTQLTTAQVKKEHF